MYQNILLKFTNSYTNRNYKNLNEIQPEHVFKILMLQIKTNFFEEFVQFDQSYESLYFRLKNLFQKYSLPFEYEIDIGQLNGGSNEEIIKFYNLVLTVIKVFNPQNFQTMFDKLDDSFQPLINQNIQAEETNIKNKLCSIYIEDRNLGAKSTDLIQKVKQLLEQNQDQENQIIECKKIVEIVQNQNIQQEEQLRKKKMEIDECMIENQKITDIISKKDDEIAELQRIIDEFEIEKKRFDKQIKEQEEKIFFYMGKIQEVNLREQDFYRREQIFKREEAKYKEAQKKLEENEEKIRNYDKMVQSEHEYKQLFNSNTLTVNELQKKSQEFIEYMAKTDKELLNKKQIINDLESQLAVKSKQYMDLEKENKIVKNHMKIMNGQDQLQSSFTSSQMDNFDLMRGLTETENPNLNLSKTSSANQQIKQLQQLLEDQEIELKKLKQNKNSEIQEILDELQKYQEQLRKSYDDNNTLQIQLNDFKIKEEKSNLPNTEEIKKRFSLNLNQDPSNNELKEQIKTKDENIRILTEKLNYYEDLLKKEQYKGINQTQQLIIPQTKKQDDPENQKQEQMLESQKKTMNILNENQEQLMNQLKQNEKELAEAKKKNQELTQNLLNEGEDKKQLDKNLKDKLIEIKQLKIEQQNQLQKQQQQENQIQILSENKDKQKEDKIIEKVEFQERFKPIGQEEFEYKNMQLMYSVFLKYFQNHLEITELIGKRNKRAKQELTEKFSLGKMLNE